MQELRGGSSDSQEPGWGGQGGHGQAWLSVSVGIGGGRGMVEKR